MCRQAAHAAAAVHFRGLPLWRALRDTEGRLGRVRGAVLAAGAGNATRGACHGKLAGGPRALVSGPAAVVAVSLQQNRPVERLGEPKGRPASAELAFDRQRPKTALAGANCARFEHYVRNNEAFKTLAAALFTIGAAGGRSARGVPQLLTAAARRLTCQQHARAQLPLAALLNLLMCAACVFGGGASNKVK